MAQQLPRSEIIQIDRRLREIEQRLDWHLGPSFAKTNLYEPHPEPTKIVLHPATTLVIASGVITVTGSYHIVDTQSAGATDDLDTINGGRTGQILIIKAANSARTVVVKNGTGNIVLPADFSMDNANDVQLLFYDGTNWLSVTNSNNGA